MKNTIYLCLLFLLMMSSCSLEKRHYRDGFYFRASHPVAIKNSVYSIPKNRVLPVPVSAERGIISMKDSVPVNAALQNNMPVAVGKTNSHQPNILKKKKFSGISSVIKYDVQRPKGSYHARPYLILGGGLFALAVLALGIFLFFMGGWGILFGILLSIMADSISFLLFLSINDDEIPDMKKWKKFILLTGKVILWCTLLLLFPVTVLWFWIYTRFMIRGDMS